ncbi:MAG: hypothetical protein ACI841_004654 [Planctomycetota bacterium]|jgi:hypothetical protein
MRRDTLLAAVGSLTLAVLLSAPVQARQQRDAGSQLGAPNKGQAKNHGLGANSKHEETRTFETTVLESPCPRPGAEFGFALTPLDFDGDEKIDFAVGAPGEGAVYILLGSGPIPYTRFAVFDASGRVDCDREASDDLLGTSLAAADLDGDGDDELVVGAPGASTPEPDTHRTGAIYIFGLTANGPPMLIQPRSDVEERFGQAVAFADFDLDGNQDLAVGAARSEQGIVSCGRVLVFHDVLDEERMPVELPNPNPTDAGNFGANLAVDDFDGDGFPDLFVSGIGNDSSDGDQHGGQVYCFAGDPRPDRWILVEDLVDTQDDPPRFGMHIAARGGHVLVGAPRKDTRLITDSGLGHSYSGEGLRTWRIYAHPNPKQTDLFGYRAMIGNFVGDEHLDFAFSCLPHQFNTNPNPLALYIYDGAHKQKPPLELLARSDSGDHFTMGVAAIDINGDGLDDLVLGDARYDRPEGSQTENVGRVVIYH